MLTEEKSSLFQNVQAERGILGLIVSDDSFGRLALDFIQDDFSIPEHQMILAAMHKMSREKKKIDLVTINSELTAMYGNEKGNGLTDVLLDLMGSDSVFTAKYHVKEYTEIIKSAAMRRNMLKVIEQAKTSLTTTTDDTAAILDTARQGLRDIVITRHSWKTMEDVVTATFEAIGKRAAGEEPSMPSGIILLDNITSGFHRGELTIIGARPAVGKSALGAHIALSAAEQGYQVGICSREMTDVQYGSRIFSRGADIDNDHLRTGALNEKEWESLTGALPDIARLPVSFMFTARYIEDLRMEVQKKVDEGHLDMLMVDYVQLMQTRQRFDKDYLRIGYVSKMLKDMTVDFNISVVALAQVGRSVENNMPNLSDLRGSGDLEQDADNVIFIHRPKDAADPYVHPLDKASFAQLKERGLQYIALNIAKQRQGQIGTVCVIFDPARMRYTPIERRG